MGENAARAPNPNPCAAHDTQMGLVLASWSRHLQRRLADVYAGISGLRDRPRTPAPAHSQSRQVVYRDIAQLLAAQSLAYARNVAKVSLTHAIGNLSPCSFAQAMASSYPASACRITPVPGSFQSTCAMRLSAASLPSQPMPRPACWL